MNVSINKNKIFILPLVVLCFFSLSFADEGERYESFEYSKNIKDDFCGIHINYQYCKCAYHNDFCDLIGMDKREANNYVNEEYILWIKNSRQTFAQTCINKDGIWNLPLDKCIYCDTEYVKTKGRCILDKEYESIEDKYGLPKDMSWLDKPKKVEIRAKIARVNGEMFVYSATFRKWIGPVNPGQPIYAGDYVLTTSRGSGDITIYSKTGADTILIGKDTSFEVVEYEEYKGYTLSGMLYDGIVEVYHAIRGDKKKTERPGIKTVTINTGARGTDFIVSHDKDTNISKVYLIEGEVDVSPISNPNEVHSLEAGEAISYDKKEFEESKVSQDKWNELLEENNLVRSNLEVKMDLDNLSKVPIDLDSVIPESLAYTGDLAGNMNDLEEEVNGGGSSYFWLSAIIIILVLSAFFWKSKGNIVKKKGKK